MLLLKEFKKCFDFDIFINFQEIHLDQLNKVSHRYKAIEEMVKFLKENQDFI